MDWNKLSTFLPCQELFSDFIFSNVYFVDLYSDFVMRFFCVKNKKFKKLGQNAPSWLRITELSSILRNSLFQKIA